MTNTTKLVMAAGVGFAAYWFFFRKKDLTLSDMGKTPTPADNKPTDPTTSVNPSQVHYSKPKMTVEDLQLVYVKPISPDAYTTQSFTGGPAMNTTPTSMQAACKCNDKKNKKGLIGLNL